MQIGYTIVPLQFPKVQIICFISEDKHVFLFRPLLSSPWPFLIYLMATMFNAALFIISTPLSLLSSVYSIVNITKGTNLSPTGFHFYHQNCIVKVFWIFPFETWDLIKLNAILSFDTSTSVHISTVMMAHLNLSFFLTFIKKERRDKNKSSLFLQW